MTTAADAAEIRRLARDAHGAALEGVAPAVASALRDADAAFDARIAAVVTPEPRRRTVTPIADLFAAFAAASAFAASVGAGRLTGGTWLNAPDVVAVTVVVSAVISGVLLLVGAGYAARERTVLRGQRYGSASVSRSGILWATAGIATGTFIATAVRLLIEPVIPASVIALVLSLALTGLAVALAVPAHREADRGAAGGKLLPRPGGDPAARARNESLSAGEDARDFAADALDALTAEQRAALEDAYRRAIAEVAARPGIPGATVTQLRKLDAVAARYCV